MIDIRRHLLEVVVGSFALATVAAAGWLGAKEWSAWQAVQDEYERLESQGWPVDDASVAEWFRDRTHSEGSRDWSEISFVLSHAKVSELPRLGHDDDSGPFLEPGVGWPSEPLVAEFLEQMKPVLDRIESAGEHPLPVWQPIQFNGFATLLPQLNDSRTILRFLSLEVDHATYTRDADRAMRALKCQQRTAMAFDSQLVMVTEMVHSALVQNHYSSIQATLCCDMLNEVQVDELIRELEQPLNLSERWRNTIAGERAFVSATWDGDFGNGTAALAKLYGGPSSKLAYLQSTVHWGNLADNGLPQLIQQAEAEDKQFSEAPRDFMSQLLTPALAGFARGYERLENERRLTLTALGVKKYFLQQSAWPESLSQLTDVGLRADDWTRVDGASFVFERKDDGCEIATRALVPNEDPASQQRNPRSTARIANAS